MASEHLEAGGWAEAVLLLPLRAYKRWISPQLAPACRYVPTCSEYAEEAIVRHGVLKGGLMAVWRLLRCHPLVAGGFDPVPCNRTNEDAPGHPSSH